MKKTMLLPMLLLANNLYSAEASGCHAYNVHPAVKQFYAALASAEVDASATFLEGRLNTQPLADDKVTPLHVMAKDGGLSSIHDFKFYGQDINWDVRDENDQTPLHWAAMHAQDVRTIDELVIVGAPQVDAVDALGITPLGVAARAGRIDAVMRLLGRGANVNGIAHNDKIVSPLALSRNFGVAAVLLAAGAHVDGKDGDGRTLLENNESKIQPDERVRTLCKKYQND